MSSWNRLRACVPQRGWHGRCSKCVCGGGGGEGLDCEPNAVSSQETQEVSDMPPQRTRARRGAVSASVMTEEQATSYVKKVRMPMGSVDM